MRRRMIDDNVTETATFKRRTQTETDATQRERKVPEWCTDILFSIPNPDTQQYSSFPRTVFSDDTNGGWFAAKCNCPFGGRVGGIRHVHKSKVFLFGIRVHEARFLVVSAHGKVPDGFGNCFHIGVAVGINLRANQEGGNPFEDFPLWRCSCKLDGGRHSTNGKGCCSCHPEGHPPWATVNIGLKLHVDYFVQKWKL